MMRMEEGRQGLVDDWESTSRSAKERMENIISLFDSAGFLALRYMAFDGEGWGILAR